MIQAAKGPESNDGHEDYLPARMLNEFVYCPRLFYLEHVDGLFAHNHDTIEGAIRHSRVDGRTDALPAGNASSDRNTADGAVGRPPHNEVGRPPHNENDAQSGSLETETEGSVAGTTEHPTIHARSVTLASDHYGVIAKLDLVEANGSNATPVDYKRGPPRKLDDGSLDGWEPERVQLCVQSLVLREHGYECTEGVLFYWETRQRVRVAIDLELIAITEQAIQQACATMASVDAPPPLVDSPKCPRCSMVGICLPDEINTCRQVDSEGHPLMQPLLFDIGPQWSRHLRTEDRSTSDAARPMITAREQRRPLYLNSQGYSLGKSGEVLQVKDKKKLVQEIRMREVSQINVMGSVQVSTQAIQSLLQAEIPLLYFTMGGWFYGMTQSVGLKNIMWRREQFRLADSQEFCLRLAKQLVSAKIRNQRTLLMRNHCEPPTDSLRFLKAMQGEAERADSIPSLLGIEGLAARIYFEQFGGMIKCAEPEGLASGVEDRPAWLHFDFQGRNRRPPRDPINALLSLGYSVLAKDLTVTCASVGLDPYLGFYHQPRFGRPALALDLMEPFRPLIVDSAVLSGINTRMIQPAHFVAAGDAVALTADGRKAFFRAYEQRMDQLVTHPLFGYRVSYRRVLEIQTRLLARVLNGEIWNYPSFVTR